MCVCVCVCVYHTGQCKIIFRTFFCVNILMVLRTTSIPRESEAFISKTAFWFGKDIQWCKSGYRGSTEAVTRELIDRPSPNPLFLCVSLQTLEQAVHYPILRASVFNNNVLGCLPSLVRAECCTMSSGWRFCPRKSVTAKKQRVLHVLSLEAAPTGVTPIY